MIRRFMLAASFAIVSFACNSPTPEIANGANEKVEPPLKFTVTVGGKSTTVSEGETVQLDGTFTNPKITVVPQPYRIFPYQGVTFNYPRSFTFEADLTDPDTKTWTLSGNDFVIMYFVSEGSLTADSLAKHMIEKFGRKNARIANANARVTLGKHTLNGTSLRVSIADHQMVMDIYSVPSRDGKARLLTFQDNVNDAGGHSEEGRRTLADLKKSFVIER